MSYWLKFILVLSAIFIIIPLYFPKITLAATKSYQITQAIPTTPSPGRFFNFFNASLVINYQSGKMLLSSDPNGLQPSYVDDFLRIRVNRPDGGVRFFSNLYASNDCSQPHILNPSELTSNFQPGNNTVEVYMSDSCGTNFGSTALYLVNLNAPDPSPPPPETFPSKTPLVIIPGIGGSELKVLEDTVWNKDNGHGGIFNHAYQKDEKVWINEGEAANLGDDDYFDILKFKPDGQTPEANLGLTGNLFAGAYKETLDFFINEGYTLNKDLFIFPYDWRKDISLTAPLLDQKIDEIISLSKFSKVDIVAHSMGGLVARNYIADQSRADKVRKLVELGVPHLGTVEFLKALRYGECITKPNVPQQPICLGVTPDESKDILQNMVGAFELSSSQKYYDFYFGNDLYPFPFNDEKDIDQNGVTGFLNYTNTKQLLTNLGHNTSLFIPAESFHNLDYNLENTNGVDTTIIAGSGIPTLGQIIEKNQYNFLGVKQGKKDEVKINGDDTVPLYSASLNDPDRNLSIKGEAKLFYTNQTHNGLVAKGPALNLVKNLLNDDGSTVGGTSNTPFKLNGTQLSVHSPVNIHVYDSNNNHTGPTSEGSFESNIQGSYYDSLDDAKFVFLPESGIYTIKFESLGEGSFDFKISTYTDDLLSKVIFYKDVPLKPDTKGETTFDTNSDSPPLLNVDDIEIKPFSSLIGDSISDNTPPEIKVIFNLESKKIEIKGIDQISNSQTKLISTSKALILDETGNGTILNYEFKKGGLKIILKDFSSSSLEVYSSFDRKSGKLISLTQAIYLSGQKIMASTYDPKKNKTTLNKINRGKSTTVEIKDGISLLYLQTKNGKLEAWN